MRRIASILVLLAAVAVCRADTNNLYAVAGVGVRLTGHTPKAADGLVLAGGGYHLNDWASVEAGYATPETGGDAAKDSYTCIRAAPWQVWHVRPYLAAGCAYVREDGKGSWRPLGGLGVTIGVAQGLAVEIGADSLLDLSGGAKLQSLGHVGLLTHF